MFHDAFYKAEDTGRLWDVLHISVKRNRWHVSPNSTNCKIWWTWTPSIHIYICLCQCSFGLLAACECVRQGMVTARLVGREAMSPLELWRSQEDSALVQYWFSTLCQQGKKWTNNQKLKLERAHAAFISYHHRGVYEFTDLSPKAKLFFLNSSGSFPKNFSYFPWAFIFQGNCTLSMALNSNVI